MLLAAGPSLAHIDGRNTHYVNCSSILDEVVVSVAPEPLGKCGSLLLSHSSSQTKCALEKSRALCLRPRSLCLAQRCHRVKYLSLQGGVMVWETYLRGLVVA